MKRRSFLSRLGTCVGTSCMPHCQSALDCEVELRGDAAAPASSSSDDAAADATQEGEAGLPTPRLPPCSFSCQPALPRHDIGVCAPAGGDL